MSSKAITITLALITGLILVAASLNNASATLQNQDIVTQIKEDNEQFSKMLNNKNNPEALMQFLHNKVDNDAEIVMNINNPEIKEAGEIEMKLTKADYINSYLYGPRQVRNYQASIKTLDVNVDEASKAVTTKEMMTESGFMMNPNDYQDKGRSFTSYTSCTSKHDVTEDGDIRLKHSTCHTDILYDEAV